MNPARWCLPLAWLLALPAFAAVEVAQFASAGNGTRADPWRGWDTAITWTGETEYFFRTGYFSYSVSPNFLKTGIALRGEAGTVLKHVGAGNAVVFDNPGTHPGGSASADNWTMNVRMQNFIIEGNPATTNGLFLRGVRNGIFEHISVRDVRNAGIWTEACVTNELRNFRVTKYESPGYNFAVRPDYGIVFAARGPDTTTTWTVTNAVVEGTGSIGIWIQAGSYGNTFINGTSETNVGKGMRIDSWDNTIINTDFEANGDTDVEINADRNRLINVTSLGTVVINPSQMNALDGGSYHDITIHPYSHFTRVTGVNWGTGTLKDGPPDTIKFGNQSVSDGQIRQTFVGSVQDPMETLSEKDGVLATDAARGNAFQAVLSRDTVLANPANGTNGQAVTWRFRQDDAGGHSLAFGTLFESLGGTMPAVRRGPGSYTEMTARYNSNENKWQFP